MHTIWGEALTIWSCFVLHSCSIAILMKAPFGLVSLCVVLALVACEVCMWRGDADEKSAWRCLDGRTALAPVLVTSAIS